MRRNLVIVGLVAALAVAALVDGLRGSASGPAEGAGAQGGGAGTVDRLEGPDAPPAGALPGTLVIAAGDGCPLTLVELASSSLGDPGVETLCRVWASPAGTWAVAPVDAGERAGIRELALVRLSEEPGVAVELGPGRGDVAWAPDGERLALCRPDGTTVVREVATESERRVRGCHPRFGPDGTLYTDSVRPLSAELMRDGNVVLGADDFERGFDARSTGPIDLLSFDVAADGLVAAAVSRQIPTGTKVVLELWREGSLEAAIALPSLFGNGSVRLGEFLRFAPNGRELAIGYSSGAGRITIVDLELERLLVEEVDLRAFAWSPDGSWLAVALEGEIQVFGALRDVPAYVLPLDVTALDWSGQEEPAPAG